MADRGGRKSQYIGAGSIEKVPKPLGEPPTLGLKPQTQWSPLTPLIFTPPHPILLQFPGKSHRIYHGNVSPLPTTVFVHIAVTSYHNTRSLPVVPSPPSSPRDLYKIINQRTHKTANQKSSTPTSLGMKSKLVTLDGKAPQDFSPASFSTFSHTTLVPNSSRLQD